MKLRHLAPAVFASLLAMSGITFLDCVVTPAANAQQLTAGEQATQSPSAEQPTLIAGDPSQPKHLFILSGQSNMARLNPAETFTPAVELAFGKSNVIVVKDAEGGQPIRRWHRDWKPNLSNKAEPIGDLYERLIKKVNAAIKHQTISSVTFIWMQGERDAREGNGAVYADSLNGLLDQLRADLDRQEINFVIGRLSDNDNENKRCPHWTMIREVQVQVADTSPTSDWVDTDDLNDGLNSNGQEIKNDLHLSVAGYQTLGKRFAEKSIQLIQITSAEEKPPAKSNRRATLNLQPDEIVSYKTIGDVDLHLHFFNPAGSPVSAQRPAIVFFFGGGWNGGTPEQFYLQSRYLATRGMVAICAEYRIKSKHGTTPMECVKDGKSAIRWVRTHAAEYGIDPHKIAAGGGSAGGHVAAATALVTAFDEDADTSISCAPNALVLFNPVFDNGPKGYGYDRVKPYWQQISPMHNIAPGSPPTIVFLGTSDILIPVATAEKYKQQMEAAGCRCDLHLYDGQAHGFFNTGELLRDTLLKTDQFLVSSGFLSGQPTVDGYKLQKPKK